MLVTAAPVIEKDYGDEVYGWDRAELGVAGVERYPFAFGSTTFAHNSHLENNQAAA